MTTHIHLACDSTGFYMIYDRILIILEHQNFLSRKKDLYGKGAWIVPTTVAGTSESTNCGIWITIYETRDFLAQTEKLCRRPLLVWVPKKTNTTLPTWKRVRSIMELGVRLLKPKFLVQTTVSLDEVVSWTETFKPR